MEKKMIDQIENLRVMLQEKAAKPETNTPEKTQKNEEKNTKTRIITVSS